MFVDADSPLTIKLLNRVLMIFMVATIAGCEKQLLYNMTMLFKHAKYTRHQQSGPKRYAWNSLLATIGYVLSPLSWWNDLVVNVPLAYAFSIPFTFLHERLFIPSFILGYWLTNLLGFILMHKGVVGIVSKQPHKVSFQRYIIVALLYTVVIALMVWFEWIPVPTELINKFT